MIRAARHSPLASSLLILPLLLAGCDLAPRYQRPAPAAPAAFPQGGAYPALPATTATPVTAIGWKDFFTDARLRQVIALGLANNRDLRVSAANILQARAEYRVQRADLLPTVTVGPTASVRHTGSNGSSVGSSTGGSGESGGSTTTHSYGVEAGVSAFELDLFGRVRNLSKAALDQYFASQAAQDSARISLISEIASAWLTLASDQDRLQISQQTVKSFTQSLDITKAQFDRGIVSELDVRQAETALQSAQYDAAQRVTQIAQDQNALNLLVGTTVTADLLPQGLGTGDYTLADLPAGLGSDILLKRPDVVQAEDLLKAQDANIGAARAAFFPTISLTAAAGTAAGGLSGLFAGGSWSYSGSGSALATIFDFGRNRANLQYARASQQAAVATYEKAVQTAFREVADALAERGTIGAQLGARDASVTSAGRAATLSEARYTNGIDAYLVTLDAERTLYTARDSLVQARLARIANLVTLYSALGGGLA